MSGKTIKEIKMPIDGQDQRDILKVAELAQKSTNETSRIGFSETSTRYDVHEGNVYTLSTLPVRKVVIKKGKTYDEDRSVRVRIIAYGDRTSKSPAITLIGLTMQDVINCRGKNF